MNVNPHKKTFIAVAIGASGTGKSPWVKQQIAKESPARLIVWDPQGDLGSLGTVFTVPNLLYAHVIARKSFAVVFQPGDDVEAYAKPFDWLCKLAYALGSLVLFVDELADVTRPGWAPQSWTVISRKGSHKKLRVYTASQRPQGVDKTFLANCNIVHCSRLTLPRDCSYMSDILGVPPDEILNLLSDEDKSTFQWIERDLKKNVLTRGKLAF